MRARRALLKGALGLATFAVLGTALIGVAHTRWGQPLLKLPLLSRMAQHAGCPVGAIEPEAFEKVRQTKLEGEVSQTPARAHPALGFVLGQTRRVNIESWISAERASCKPGHVASVLECENITTLGTPRISRLSLQFDAEQRLVSVDLFRSGDQAEALVSRFVELSAELDRSVGPGTSSAGTPSVAFMQASPLQTLVRTYSYRDYVAKALLLNLGKRGLKLREQYQWLPPRAPA